jgi:hypothetical protein
MFPHLPDLAQMLVSFSSQFGAIITLIKIFASAAGIIYIAESIFKMVKHSDGRYSDTGGMGIFGLMLVGTALWNFSGTMDAVYESIGGNSGIGNILSYSDATLRRTPAIAAMVTAALQFMQVVGWYGAFKGLRFWAQAASGKSNNPDALWSGLIHILGGAVCINIVSFLN